MACPYFIPEQSHPRELWTHRHRLPLGDGFTGHCSVQSGELGPDDETLRLQCNLGYAKCEHLPAQRALDAVRFTIQRESDGMLRIHFTGELAHHPALAGELHYNQLSGSWLESPDPQIELLAEAAVRGWIARDLSR